MTDATGNGNGKAAGTRKPAGKPEHHVNVRYQVTVSPDDSPVTAAIDPATGRLIVSFDLAAPQRLSSSGKTMIWSSGQVRVTDPATGQRDYWVSFNGLAPVRTQPAAPDMAALLQGMPPEVLQALLAQAAG